MSAVISTTARIHDVEIFSFNCRARAHAIFLHSTHPYADELGIMVRNYASAKIY